MGNWYKSGDKKKSQKTPSFQYNTLCVRSTMYSEVFIIRPGRSRLLEFEIQTQSFNRDFFKKYKSGRLIETER